MRPKKIKKTFSSHLKITERAENLNSYAKTILYSGKNTVRRILVGYYFQIKETESRE